MQTKTKNKSKKIVLSKLDQAWTVYYGSEEMFNILANNRGSVKGYDDKRTANLMNLMIENKFYWKFSPLLVINNNLINFTVIDGANRLTGVRKAIEAGHLPKGYKIPFTIVGDKEIKKMNRNELITFISTIINNYDPRWTPKEHYNTALSANLKTALAFEVYNNILATKEIREMLTYEMGERTPVAKIKPNILFALATQSGVRNNGTKIVFNDFIDDSIGEYMQTDEFKEDFYALIDYVVIAKEWYTHKNLRISKAIFRALDLVYEHKDFNVTLSTLVKRLKETNKMPTSDHRLKSFLLNALK
jgi:hypothetical protein